VIIDYNFFGLEEGTVFDTPICTDMLDELQLNEGTYDEAYIDLSKNIVDDNVKPTSWGFTTIMDAKFTSDLDAGSIGMDGFKVTHIMLYRSVYGTSKWDAIGIFEYDEDYNVYDYVDRYTQNGIMYQYAIVPVANEVLGEKTVSQPIESSYEGIFITDRKENRRLEFDITMGEVVYNTNSALNQPINSGYPIVTFGQSKYRSSSLSVLPLSRETIALAGAGIDKFAEQVNRQEWVDFLNNGKAKVLRMDNGVLMLIVTHNVTQTHKEGDLLRPLASLQFDYTEIGEITFDTMMSTDLLSTSAFERKTTFNENGAVVSG
jgi:hypothetical protein